MVTAVQPVVPLVLTYMRVEVLESGCVILTNKHAGLEQAFQHHLTDEADRLARIETKLDALLKR